MKHLKSNISYNDKKTNTTKYLTYDDAILLHMYVGMCYSNKSLLSISNSVDRDTLGSLLPTNEQYIEIVDSNGKHWYDYSQPIKKIHTFFQPYLNFLCNKKFIQAMFPKDAIVDQYNQEVYEINHISTHFFLTSKGLKRAEKLYMIVNRLKSNDNHMLCSWPLSHYLSKDDLTKARKYPVI